jgi:hypothetical protein
MKVSFPLSLAVVFLSMAGLPLAANPERLAPANQTAVSPKQAAVPPEFVAITDDPSLPRVLLMGDSVSIAYALEVRKALKGKANVHRVPANCGSTKTALGSYGLVRWIADEHAKWDVIHFNHGLHDLSYRFADDADKDKDGNYATPFNGGHPNVSLSEYEANLRAVVARLKRTGAKLIFASTTPVPECDAGKYVKDSELPYNEVAHRVMAAEGVLWNDLWAHVKPDQERLQGKRNVHFIPTGSAFMAMKVSESIAAALANPADANATKSVSALKEKVSSAALPISDADWLRSKGSLIFHDAFEREEEGNGMHGIGNGWESATADRVPHIKQADLDGGVLKVASASKEAGHQAHIHHDAGFADGGVIVRFKFPGMNKDETLQLGFVDREEKGLHAGHLCYGILNGGGISLVDHKTGVMNLAIRSQRQAYLDRKEPLPAELDALLKRKQIVVPWTLDHEWHELVLVTESDEMRLSLDGKELARHRSDGFAHPMKRWFSFLANNTVWIEDVKILKVR